MNLNYSNLTKLHKLENNLPFISCFSPFYTLKKVFPSIVDTIECLCYRVCVVNSLDNFKGCKCLTNSLWWKQGRYLCESLLPDKIQWCRWRVGRVGFSKPTRNLGVKLTLFQPWGGADHAHHINVCHPDLET